MWYADLDTVLAVDLLMQPRIKLIFGFWLGFWFYVVKTAHHTVKCDWAESQLTPLMRTTLKRVLLSGVVTANTSQDKQVMNIHRALLCNENNSNMNL